MTLTFSVGEFSAKCDVPAGEEGNLKNGHREGAEGSAEKGQQSRSFVTPSALPTRPVGFMKTGVAAGRESRGRVETVRAAAAGRDFRLEPHQHLVCSIGLAVAAKSKKDGGPR